jgi:N-acetylmuramoyl-L-alanine amidase
MEDHNTDILARTIWGEARGEIMAGKIAVAWTIKNRAAIAAAYEKQHGVARQHYGDGSIASACQMPKQYSCWNSGDANLIAMEAVDDESGSFRDCLAVARQVIAGTLADPVQGATHYYADTLPEPPAWAVGHEPVAHIGHHLFFKNIPA